MSHHNNTRSTPTGQLQPGMHLHLVGVGGSGLSAIARVLLGRGFTVSGSDRQANDQTAALEQLGATVFIGHDERHVAGADLLLVSSAIPANNPELVAAQSAGIPVVKRDQFLGQLMAGQHGIAVAGTHGKTTTTGLIAHILIAAGLDPSLVMGGVLPELAVNGRAGQGPHFVVEADEYDHMFLGLQPETAVITNLEHDHPDLFTTPEAYAAAFHQFLARLPAGGRLVACADDPGVRSLLASISLPGVTISTYGLESADDPACHYRALDLRPNQLGGTDFLLQFGGELVGLARLRIPGDHNVRNALAAAGVALGLGLDFNAIRPALMSFGGMGRRFQLVGEVADVTIVDDYAHHPTEIRATLAAARQRYRGRRLWAVWQPHTYSRTRLLRDQFAASFDDADRVIALAIYRSRETDTLGIDTTAVVAQMQHPDVAYIPELRDAAEYILNRVRPGDVVLTLGAGDSNLVGEWVLAGLRQRFEPAHQP